MSVCKSDFAQHALDAQALFDVARPDDCAPRGVRLHRDGERASVGIARRLLHLRHHLVEQVIVVVVEDYLPHMPFPVVCAVKRLTLWDFQHWHRVSPVGIIPHGVYCG
jgi:hypothetical protein